MTKFLIVLMFYIGSNHAQAEKLSITKCRNYSTYLNFQKVQICFDSEFSDPGTIGKVKITGGTSELEFDAKLVEIKREEVPRGETCNLLSYTNTILVLGVEDINLISSFGVPLYMEEDEFSCRNLQSIQFTEILLAADNSLKPSHHMCKVQKLKQRTHQVVEVFDNIPFLIYLEAGQGSVGGTFGPYDDISLQLHLYRLPTEVPDTFGRSGKQRFVVRLYSHDLYEQLIISIDKGSFPIIPLRARKGEYIYEVTCLKT